MFSVSCTEISFAVARKYEMRRTELVLLLFFERSVTGVLDSFDSSASAKYKIVNLNKITQSINIEPINKTYLDQRS